MKAQGSSAGFAAVELFSGAVALQASLRWFLQAKRWPNRPRVPTSGPVVFVLSRMRCTSE